MNLPANYKYTKDHEWISVDDDNTAAIGLTEYAIEHLGDIVHIEFPAVGDDFDAGVSFGTIESTKTVTDCFIPVGGKIIDVNDGLLEHLESLAEDPYDDGWLVKIELNSRDELDQLLSFEEYESYLTGLE